MANLLLGSLTLTETYDVKWQAASEEHNHRLRVPEVVNVRYIVADELNEQSVTHS